MKTISVSGKGVKSKKISLSKAAKYLAQFVESDNGASEAHIGFLKRASAAFNELHAFRKEINKEKSSQLEVGLIEDGRSKREVIVDEVKEHKKKKNKRKDKICSGVEAGEVNVDEGKESKKKKKKDRVVQEGETGSGVDAGKVDGRKRKKLDEGRFDDASERKSEKRRKKNREVDG